MNPSPPMIAPPTISARPPRRSITGPTTIASSPVTTVAIVWPSDRSVRVQPRSSVIGFRNTPSVYACTPADIIEATNASATMYQP